MGTVDRALRAIAGLVLIALALFGGHWWGSMSIVPLATAFVGFSPPTGCSA